MSGALLIVSGGGEDMGRAAALLEKALPGRDIRLWPALGDAREIAYALVWQPPRGLLASLPGLRAVLSLGAGIDHVLSDPALPADVPVYRLIDDDLTARMSEYVVLHVLRHHRQQPAYEAQQRAHVWRPLRQPAARRRRVGILGLGVLGADAAAKLALLGFAVSGWSRREKSLAGVQVYHGAAGLGALLGRSDILVCLLPATPATAGLLNRKRLARLPAGASLINAGRGALLVEDDLLALLAEGHVSHATLDVFANEPLAGDHPLWDHPAVTITPHVAAATSGRALTGFVARTLAALEAGKEPPGRVDRDQNY